MIFPRIPNQRQLLHPLQQITSVVEQFFGDNYPDFLHKFVLDHLEHVEDVDATATLADDQFPQLLHTAIRLSFAQKQRDRANREKNEANREKNEAVRDRDAAVKERESMLRDIRAASYYIGKYD